MNDPKYTIRDGRLWHIEGDYPIPDDEPVMVLRGKDPVALYAIACYANSHTCEAHIRSSHERLDAFKAFQSANPDRVNTDCTKNNK